ncbi:hypothetical protein [Nevskia sp.]|uniref:hypothetical protein n=1 Tax=Nevskia sp. TaxID=1929292 RepID=UPI003F6E6652
MRASHAGITAICGSGLLKFQQRCAFAAGLMHDACSCEHGCGSAGIDRKLIEKCLMEQANTKIAGRRAD